MHYGDNSVKERDTVALAVKRKLLVNRNPLHGSDKKSKVFPSPVDDSDDDDDDVPISWRINIRSAISTDKSFSVLKEELEFVEKSFEECKRKSREEEKRLESVKRDIVECEKELENKKQLVGSARRIKEIHDKMMGKIEGCVKDFVVKEAHLCLIEDLIRDRRQELRGKEMELCRVMSNISKEREFECQMKELLDDLVLKQKHFESRTKELESKKKHFERQVDELKAKVKELEPKEKLLDGRVKQFASKEDEFEGRVKELESEKKQLDGRVKEFDSKEDEFEGRVKKLESEKKHFESPLKQLESKENQFKEQMKEYQEKEEELRGRVKVFELKEEEFEGRFKELKSKEKQFQERWKELESKKKQFEEQVKNPESKRSKHEEKESVTSYMDDALSPTIDETSLQLVLCEQTDILANLREISDPAKVVLDIILNPILPLYDKNGVNAVNIDKRSIYLLELLMKISPNIKPCVREEAMRLALDLKATIKENTEKNSLAVLGFLQVLSVYGLVTSFDQDEVSELFASVAQHRIAWELSRPLGFCK